MKRLLTSGLLGLCAAWLLTAMVMAYAGEVAAQVVANGPGGVLRCHRDLPLTATVVDKNGKAIEGQPVSWSITATPSSDDVLGNGTTITNANGVATTTINMDCVVGDRSVRATADDAFDDIALTLSEAGLPGTFTAPSNTTPAWALAAAALAVLVGAGLLARRIRG